MAFSLHKIVVCVVLFCANLYTSYTQSSIEEKAKSSLRRIFGDSISVAQSYIVLDSSDQRKLSDRMKYQALPESILVYRCKTQDKPVGFGFVDNVKGKAQLITYLVAVQPSGEVEDVDVLVYRESFGGEIANESFRRQFRKKTTDDRLRAGVDIKNISGATISVRAITLGVRKILLIYDVIKSRLF